MRMNWGLLIIVCILATVFVVRDIALEKRLETTETELYDTQGQLAFVKSQMIMLLDEMKQSEEASNVLIEKTEKASKDRAQKLMDLETDPGSCDWLDNPLPERVRNNYCRADDDTAD